jgi:hypothetical protein
MAKDSPILGLLCGTASNHGWMWQHQRPITDQKGRTRTAVSGWTGLPDLLLVHAERRLVLLWEIKSADGYPSDQQVLWVSRTLLAQVVRERDLQTALNILKGQTAPDAPMSLTVDSDGQWAGSLAGWATKRYGQAPLCKDRWRVAQSRNARTLAS